MAGLTLASPSAERGVYSPWREMWRGYSRHKLAVVGDISAHLNASSALRDWVRESNKRDTIRFVPSFDDLAADARPLPAE